jgi:hypothetical protein
LPKATDVDSDSDSDESVDSDDSLDSDDEDGDDAESDDEDKEDDGKASAGKSSKSPVASSTATRPAITSPILANQRAGVTGIPETTTSKGITGGEKAAIAVATIGEHIYLSQRSSSEVTHPQFRLRCRPPGHGLVLFAPH